MKLALHRSITFWSGILMMGFICWAWWRSGFIFNAAGGTSLYVGNIGSGVFLSHEEGSWSGWRSYNEPIHGGMPPNCPGPYFVSCRAKPDESIVALGWPNDILGSGRPGTWSIFLPHWLLLLALALVWAGLLIWRARRRRKESVPGDR